MEAIMQKSQVESRVYQIVDIVNAGQIVEDDRVELKGEWIDAKKSARLVAGHANASRGEPILWLMGLDEKRGVQKIEPGEFSNWWNQFKSRFNEGIHPDLVHHINVPVDGLTVVALYFATDRAPYVVQHENSGNLEVPWRQGGSTYPVKRSQLLRMLAPVVRMPSAQILKAVLEVRSNRPDAIPERRGFLEWELDIDLYVVPAGRETVVIPKWQTLAHFEVPTVVPRTQCVTLDYPKRHASPNDNGSMDYHVKGPGIISFKFHGYTHERLDGDRGQPGRVWLEMTPIDPDIPIRLEAEMLSARSATEGTIGAWLYKLNTNGVELLL